MRKVDHVQRRQEVAEAAARIIAYDGLDALTTRNLAKSMGCSIGVLSHYFSNKDEIVMAAMTWADERIWQRFDQTLAKPLTVDNFEPVILSAFPLDEQSDLEWRVRLNLAAYSQTHPRLMAQQAAERTERFQRIMKVIRQMQNLGAIRSDVSAELITQNAIDLLTGTAYNLLCEPMESRRAKVDFVFAYLQALQTDTLH